LDQVPARARAAGRRRGRRGLARGGGQRADDAAIDLVAECHQLTAHKGAHPRVGQTGDLFVDHNHHLWFCRGGTTWVRLA